MSLEKQIADLEDEIKILNDVFHDHKERFIPKATKVMEVRAERAEFFKTVLQKNQLQGWAGLILNAPIQIYIKEIENIYKLQMLFLTKENLEKIKASCNALSIMHNELMAIPNEAHDEASLANRNAFVEDVNVALGWGNIFFKQLEVLDGVREKLIAKNIELQKLKAQEQAKSLHTNAFFFGNLFYNPAYAA
ncbi:MAG: hypothetical protein WC748_10305 [Legionellales bacterium]|jgi:hypothetical protein